MELNYEFDAPKFVDFLQLAETDDGSDTDAWFDERNSNKSQASTQKPTRTAVAHEKPARVRVANPSRPTCPSPKKQSKLSSEHAVANTPAANTRSKTGQIADDSSGKRFNIEKLSLTKENERSKEGGTANRQPPARCKLQQFKPSVSTPNLHKTSEDMELEKIAAMRAEAARARKKAQAWNLQWIRLNFFFNFNNCVMFNFFKAFN
ncbi:hypothetical protein PoB_007000800 [Plakobranchus ocellatus]|uniref:Aurora-A binding domain-containing protein n=1 Tax=Plakobranchus ocellatus TaxID=259542 RepID=A0AAV4DGS4_9GAST|nr:hypothetical protein PoB_007000800 [Plakobranchus ocellatus]